MMRLMLSPRPGPRLRPVLLPALVLAAVTLVFAAVPAAGQTAGAAQAAAAGDPWGAVGFLDVSALYDAITQTADVATEHEINAEAATITSSQDVGGRPLLDVGFGRRIHRDFAIGGSVTYGATSKEAEITGDIPHPFYFDQPRPLRGAASLDRRDLMIHIHPMWLVRLTPKLSSTLFGGATWFRVEQETVQSLDLIETYPYDEVSLAGIERQRETGSHWGGHIGGDVSYVINRQVGVRALVRYARGTVTLTANGVDSDITVGGLHVGAGLRFRF